MSAPLVQGWCPGALRPMMSGDGLVVRIRARCGRLARGQALGLAELAAAHGNGLIDVSARANLQLRGIREKDHPALVEALAALGLVDDDAVFEARRNLVISPFWVEGDPAPRIARMLEAALAGARDLALPGKFGFAIEAGETPVLTDVSADIRIEPRADGGFLVRPDGAAAGAPVEERDVAGAALALARWFLASGGAPSGRGRMRAHLADGAMLPPRFLAASACAVSLPRPLPGLVAPGALVGLAFGQMTAETFARLASLGPLRLTPWRLLLVEGATAMPGFPGLIATADDPLLRVVACTGAPGCLQARQSTRDLARSLAPLIPPGGLLHVSGCAKGCAHPASAPLTLVGAAAGFDLVRDGPAAAPPALAGLPADAARLAGACGLVARTGLAGQARETREIPR